MDGVAKCEQGVHGAQLAEGEQYCHDMDDDAMEDIDGEETGNHYGQHMTGHQQETSIFNAAMGQSYGLNLQNGFPSFGAPGTCLPPDATSTLYVDGLPTNCTKREVAHIFRQYMGFRELRLVNKGLHKHAICFVDFATPEQAFFTMRTLQGYKFDEQDHNSRVLNLQFSHSPRMGSHGGC